MPPSRPNPECLYCGCDRLGSPDEPVGIDSVIICGGCASLHRLNIVYEVNAPDSVTLRRPTRQESLEAHQDPRIREFLDAWQAVQIESRLERVGKPKAKGLTPEPGRKVRHGDIVRLEARGPDA